VSKCLQQTLGELLLISLDAAVHPCALARTMRLLIWSCLCLRKLLQRDQMANRAWVVRAQVAQATT